ncbi:unnamed protein product [Clonostachys rosea f. rosea IK726]|uniref:Chromatin modification-related protein EAF6 n=2 Tax=Bionectria ochroleuca TaxID=29856 RepID=A0A0B7JXC8_BIOOC|nr:unnamed protein product [Clonostachys rosea f. rosea IK726]
MADKQQGGAGAAADSGGSVPVNMAEYKKSQARVRDLVEKRRLLEKRLAQVEDGIASKELAYLESAPSGNIITGFDNYMKGTSGAAAQRRKTGPPEQNRVFSRSSISYRPNNADSATPGSTPASHAPTPMSASFKDSGNATPTTTGGSKNQKKGKKDVDDSEAESGTNKKRTNFGASRK